MTFEEISKVKNFTISWITKVIAKRKDYGERLVNAIEDLFPDDDKYDSFGIMFVKNWDFGVENVQGAEGMGDRLSELIEGENIYGFTKKAQNDFICAIRIAMDLFVEQSGGVVGFTIGDLNKAFDGEIPSRICDMYEIALNDAKKDDGIWL